MSIQTFPLATVKKIRQYIKTMLAVPDSENHPKEWISLEELDDLPEPESLDQLGDLFKFSSDIDAQIPESNTARSWFISTVNPGSVFSKLPGLKLKSGWRLVSYLYRQQDNGVGITWAVPEALSTTAELENALVDSGDDLNPPHPVGALPNFMEALEGDRSPRSFLIASLLRRELEEFGCLGKNCQWSNHRLIDQAPVQVKWQWKTSTAPKDLYPKVLVLADGKVAVEFFTLQVIKPVVIYRHLDRYPASGYNAQKVDKAVAMPTAKK